MLQARKKALNGYHVNITLKIVSKYPFHPITLSCTSLHSLLYRNSDKYLDIDITRHTADAHECPWACKERKTSMFLVPIGSFSSPPPQKKLSSKGLKLDRDCKSGFSRDCLQNKVSMLHPLH